MRWAIPLSLSSSFSLFTTRSKSSSISLELSLSHQILSILNTPPSSSSSSSFSFEPSLDLLLSPRLTPHVISSVLASSPSFPSSFRFFLWASNLKRLRSWRSHSLIISSLLSDPSSNFQSSWDSLLQVKSLRRPISSSAFAVLIRAYADAGMPQSALEAFSRMPEFECRPDTFTYNTLLKVLVKKDAVFLALAIYNKMMKSDCRPNLASFSVLIDGLCKAGMVADARNMFDEMEQRGIVPNAMIYTIIFSSFCNKGWIDDAERLFDSMRRNGCTPDSVACSVMLSGYCKAGRMDAAFEKLRVFGEEEGFVLGVNGYGSLIDGLFRDKRFDEACRVYEEMLETKNVEPDCVLYTIMIRGYLEAGRVEEAFRFLNEMSEKGVVPDTYCYNTLIKGLCDTGRLDQARSLTLEISQHDNFPDSTTYNIMVCGLCKKGLVLEAQQIFDEMGKHGCLPTVITFNSLISGLCKAEKLEEAQSLFDKMKVNVKPSLFLRLSQGVNNRTSLRKMVEELCEAGHVVKAYKLLQDVIDVVVPDVVTYNVLINGLFKGGKPDDALKLFKQLQIMGHSPDDVTLGTLIDGLLKAHKEEDAWIVYQSMLKNGITPSLSICNTVMRILCRKKKVARAVNLWFTHISQTSKADTIKSMKDLLFVTEMKNQFDQGCIEEVVKGLIKFDRERGLANNSSPYTIWLIGYCQAWKVDEALKIFNILKESDIDATPPSCVLLIHRLCCEGKLASALNVMLYALRKGFLLMQPVGNRLLKRLCMANKKKEAHKLVWEMSLAGYDMDSYLRATTKHLLYD